MAGRRAEIFGAASMTKAQLIDAVAAVLAVPVAKKSILVDTRGARYKILWSLVTSLFPSGNDF